MTQGITARAGEVKILSGLPDDVYSVSKDPKRVWEINDRICFRRLGHQGVKIDYRDIIACGQVLDVLDDDFLVHITSRNAGLKAGVSFKAWRPGSMTYQRTAEFAKRTISTSLPDPFNQRVFSLGLQSLGPYFHLEQGISQHYSVGVQASYFASNVGTGSISGFGYHATFSYHYSELFQGPWALLGIGAFLYRGKATLNEFKNDSLSAHFSVGYRFLFFERLSLAASLGGQYIFNHNFPQIYINWGGFIPVVIMQVGYKF